MRTLAVSGTTRSAVLLDMPTLAETGLAGYLDAEIAKWARVIKAAGTKPQ